LKIKSFLFIILLFTGCTSHKFLVLDTNESVLTKFKKLPQNPDVYLQNYKDSTTLKDSQKNYENSFYSVWIKEPQYSVYDVMWAYRAYKANNKTYGINLKPLQKEFFKKIQENSNFENYKTINKKAITIRTTNIREFPTDEVLFKNPHRAGEGYPFDYLQDSLIAANKPILISHFSKDKKWAFVFSSFSSGWIKSSDIVILNKQEVNKIINAKHAYIIKDFQPIYNQSGDFVYDLRIGMMLPVVSENNSTLTLLGVSKINLHKPYFFEFNVTKNIAQTKPMLFTKKNISKILNQLKNSKYGWGGMYAQRDCSSTMKDYFAPFGIWLGRNSSIQARKGRVISLKGLSVKEKKALIIKKGVPFETLLYKRGHIVLYIGIYKNKIMVFQNIWGLKTKYKNKTGRLVLGRAIFSPVDLGYGVGFVDQNNLIINKLLSMNIVTQ